MCIVTMNMSSFEIEHSIVYGDECADWNPAPALQQQTGNRQPDAMPADLTSVDAELFMRRMYAYPKR